MGLLERVFSIKPKNSMIPILVKWFLLIGVQAERSKEKPLLLGRVTQRLEFWSYKPAVIGSNPISPIVFVV